MQLFKHQYSLSFLLAALIVVALGPFAAQASPECRNLLLSERERAIEAVPAMGHLTTITGLFGILNSEAIFPFERVKTEVPLRGVLGPAIGGSSQSAYLAPFFKSAGIRNGGRLLGPTLVLSPRVLERNDYFFNDSWEGYGSFTAGDSVVAKDISVETVKRGAEFMFSNEIKLADYAVGLWIPPGDRWAFEAVGIWARLKLKKLNIPVFFADELPPLEELKALARSKPAPVIESKYLEDHATVQGSVEYQLKDLKTALDYAENPENKNKPLFKNLVRRFNRGLWINMVTTDFDTHLRALRILLQEEHCAELWLHQLLNKNLSAIEKQKAHALLSEFVSQEKIEMLSIPKEELHSYLQSKFKTLHQALEFAKKPENHLSRDFKLLLLGFETGFPEAELSFSYVDRDLELAQVFIWGGYTSSFKFLSIAHGWSREKNKAVQELLKSR